MMTPEQEQKARAALMEKALDDFKKGNAFERHQKACKWVFEFNLPYRVSLDYLKRYKAADGVVMINRCYPLPGYPAAALLTLTPGELDEQNPDTYKVDPDGRKVLNMKIFDTPLQNIEEKIQENLRQFWTWDLETPEGLQAWELEFAHFLDGYDIDSFTAFDMFGRPDADENALYERKRYYKGVLDRFKHSKNAYRQNEPPYLPEYAEKYTDKRFILKWD